MEKSKSYKVIFAIILLLGIVNITYWGLQKEGYFVDELYTYGLANGYMTPFLQQEENYANSYHTGREFLEWLTVSNADDFQFDSVWYNQSQDVHPPFYYTIIHFLSSIFKETITPWIGLGVNYFFFATSVPVFYGIAVFILKNRWNALVATAMYVLSAGTINCILIIRMYMMLTFWILLYVWLLLHFFEERFYNTPKVLYYISITLVMILGFLTHYHFVIPAISISGIYVLYCVLHKKVKNIFYYILSCVSAIVATQYIFEYSFNHIFMSGRGLESIRNIKSADLIKNMIIMWKYVDEQIFGGCFAFVAFLAIIGIVFIIYKRIKKKDSLNNNKCKKTFCVEWTQLAIIFTTIVYFAVVSKTVTLLISRYLYPVYPLIIMTLFVMVEHISAGFRSKYKMLIVYIATVICVVLSYIVPGAPESLYRLNAIVPRIIKENYQGTDAIYITDCSYRYVSDSYCLSMHDEIYIADYNATEHLSWFDDNQEIILYINHCTYASEFGEVTPELDYYLELIDCAGYSTYKYLGNTEYSRVYVLNKDE